MRNTQLIASTEQLESIIRLWILRFLVPLGGHSKLIEPHGISNHNLVEEVGLGELLSKKDQFDPEMALRKLKAAHARAERAWCCAPLPDPVKQNLEKLSKVIGLSELEAMILGFVALLHTTPLLEDAADLLGDLSPTKLFRVISGVLGLQEQEVRQLLSKEAVLGRSGLVVIDFSFSGPLPRRLDLLSTGVIRGLFSSAINPMEIFSDFIAPVGPGNLSMSDFDYLDPELKFIGNYLRLSTHSKRPGVNLFFYGPPGTGKTELTKALASSISTELIAVSTQDENGEPITGMLRLRALRSAQELYRNQKVILLFDEAEDIFRGTSWIEESVANKHKGWLTEILEMNPVPVLWISNSTHGMDAAFIRRFDRVIKVDAPPLSKREEITNRICGDIVNPNTVSKVAEAEKATPAIVARAAQALRSVIEQENEINPDTALLDLINGTLEGQGEKPIKLIDVDSLPSLYDPGLLNPSVDLLELASRLAATRSARICFYGPPGTGKTAFARWLSKQLDLPLLRKRGSDLISMWVGGTEKNLARAFREAEQDNGLLLLDEVDSFLQDRRKARHQWEITQVNEMLTQMESFNGLFIASTNLMDNLDQAALRRFDVKVFFGYLSGSQTLPLLNQWCRQLGIEEPKAQDNATVQQLEVLTPGDFAAVSRLHKFTPFENAAGIVAALEKECALKEDGKRRRIGFI